MTCLPSENLFVMFSATRAAQLRDVPGNARITPHEQTKEDSEMVCHRSGGNSDRHSVRSPGGHKPAGGRITNHQRPDADDAGSRFDPRTLMPRLPFKQDGLALVHKARAGIMVARGSRERRKTEPERVRMG